MLANFVMDLITDFALSVMAIFITGIFGYFVARLVDEIGELFNP